jgi:hypothetical protein
MCDYIEIFTLVVKLTTIILVSGIVAAMDLYLQQLDVKIASFHGDLDWRISEQPQGFIVPGKQGPICKLKRSLYGLK